MSSGSLELLKARYLAPIALLDAAGAANDVLIAAFNQAYEDGADIITSSIGALSGWGEDPWAVAVSRIVEKGIPCTLLPETEAALAFCRRAREQQGKRRYGGCLFRCPRGADKASCLSVLRRRQEEAGLWLLLLAGRNPGPTFRYRCGLRLSTPPIPTPDASHIRTVRQT